MEAKDNYSTTLNELDIDPETGISVAHLSEAERLAYQSSATPVTEAVQEETTEPSIGDNIRLVVERQYSSKKNDFLTLVIPYVDYQDGDKIVSWIDGPEPDTTAQESVENPLLVSEPKARRISLGGLKKVLQAAKNLPSTTSDKLLGAQANITTRLQALSERITSIEDKKTKGAVAAVVAGGIAVAATYAATRGLHLSGNSHSHEAIQSAVPTKTSNHVTETLQNQPQKASNPAQHLHKPRVAQAIHGQALYHHVAEHLKPRIETLRYQGDNIWNHVQERVQAKFHAHGRRLIELTARFTNKTLQENHLTSVDARHMAQGQQFELPIQLR